MATGTKKTRERNVKRINKFVFIKINLSMILDFIMSLRQDTKTIYYKNMYKNKTGVNTNIYVKKNNSINKELELFCEPLIELIEKNESVMIVTDSKQS